MTISELAVELSITPKTLLKRAKKAKMAVDSPESDLMKAEADLLSSTVASGSELVL